MKCFDVLLSCLEFILQCAVSCTVANKEQNYRAIKIDSTVAPDLRTAMTQKAEAES